MRRIAPLSLLRLLPLSSLIASPAFAQALAAPQQALGGTAVPGLCLLSREAIFGNAKVGVAATARLERLAAAAQTEIEAARSKAMARIAETLQPLIAQVYKARNCGLLIDRNTVLGGNMANDLTPAAVTALNQQMTTIVFDRETLPVQTGAK